MSDTAPETQSETRHWLTIEAACQLLGVDQSTLRRWSDNGRVEVFVTPGGHRRYDEAALRALIGREREERRPMSGATLTDLSQVYYGPERLRWVQAQPWYHAFDRATLDEVRDEGRNLVELAMRYVSARDGRDEILAEALAIARRYGARNVRLGVSLGDGVAAFIFFRAPTIETVASYMESEHFAAKRAARIFRDLGDFLDRALLAMIAAHEASLDPREHAPRPLHDATPTAGEPRQDVRA